MREAVHVTNVSKYAVNSEVADVFPPQFLFYSLRWNLGAAAAAAVVAALFMLSTHSSLFSHEQTEP